MKIRVEMWDGFWGWMRISTLTATASTAQTVIEQYQETYGYDGANKFRFLIN